MTTLLTIDDLAARWQVTRERATRRIKGSGLKSVNLGTAKYPELRFRLETVEAWEERVEHVPIEPGSAPQGGLAPRPDRDEKRATKAEPSPDLKYRGKAKIPADLLS